jgi:hypothetical protein
VTRVGLLVLHDSEVKMVLAKVAWRATMGVAGPGSRVNIAGLGAG